MSYSYGGWEDEFQGLTKETNFAGSANKSLGAKPVKDISGSNDNNDDGGQDTTASSIFRDIAKSVVNSTDVSIEEALDILTPDHNTDVKPSGLNTSRKHNTYYKNLEENRATQFEFLQGFIDSDINETVFKPMGKNYPSSSIGVYTEVTQGRREGSNVKLKDRTSGRIVSQGSPPPKRPSVIRSSGEVGGLFDILNNPFSMYTDNFDYANNTTFTPAVAPVIEEVAPEVYTETRKGKLRDVSQAIKSVFQEKKDATIERKVNEVATGSVQSDNKGMKFKSDFSYNRKDPKQSTTTLGFETGIGSAEVSSKLYDYSDTSKYTLNTPTIDGLSATTSFGADGTSVGIDKAGDAFLGGKYNFSINADDDSNVNSSLTAGWEW
jgi:hypothetical protein